VIPVSVDVIVTGEVQGSAHPIYRNGVDAFFHIDHVERNYKTEGRSKLSGRHMNSRYDNRWSRYQLHGSDNLVEKIFLDRARLI
jgi:hypothetical protein